MPALKSSQTEQLEIHLNERSIREFNVYPPISVSVKANSWLDQICQKSNFFSKIFILNFQTRCSA